MGNDKEIAIVYMAAGLSSRFGGKIKQFAQVGPNNETLIEYSMDQAINAGFSKIIFIVGEMTEKPFKEKFGGFYKKIPVDYALQSFDKIKRDKPWGTLDALSSLGNISTPFVVCNGDDIYGKNVFKTLLEHLQKSGTAATVSYRLIDVLPATGKTNRGIIKTENGKVVEIVEVFNIDRENLDSTNSKPNDQVSMNVFALHPKDLDLIQEIVVKFKDHHRENRTIECLLPQELGNLIKEKKLIMTNYPAKDKWFGITNPSDEAIVKEKLRHLNDQSY